MALEKRLVAVSPQLLQSDGGSRGEVTVQDATLFKVKQQVILNSSTQDSLQLEVKRVKDATTMILGPKSSDIREYTDLTAFTAADGAFLIANEQSRPSVPYEEYMRAMYEEEPTVAMRSFLVDELGEKYTTQNPFPVQLSDGSINIGTVNGELEVQLSRLDNDPDAGDVHDSVRIGNQDYEVTLTENDDETKVGFDVVTLNRLLDIPHDDIEVTQFTADGDPEIIEIREGGNLKRTLTLTYNADGEFQRVVRS